MGQNKTTVAGQTFYSMCALMYCIGIYGDYVIESKIAPMLNIELGYTIKKFKLFLKKVLDIQPPALREAWEKEWTERDYEVYASVFNLMANMNEDQRLLIEEFAESVARGEATAVTADGTEIKL